MRDSGIHENVLLEDAATNTGENARLSVELLESYTIRPRSIVVVTKPYMGRRAKATFEVQWPNDMVDIRVASQRGTFLDDLDEQQTADLVINIIVGDLQRIMEYPRLGLQSKQEIPRQVMYVFDVLVREGYTKHFLV